MATTFALSWHTSSLQTLALAPLAPSSNVRFYWYDQPADSSPVRVRDNQKDQGILQTKRTGRRGTCARAGRVKTCGLIPILNVTKIIGHREIVCSQVAGQKHILVAPGSCPEPSCYSQIRLAEINGLPNSGFIVFVHRDELLIEMTEEYMIYHGGPRAPQRLWYRAFI